MTQTRTRTILAGVSAGRPEALQELYEREPGPQPSDLNERESALARIAALIALDAPPASYADHVAGAAEAGLGADEILGVLRAVAPQVGAPRVIAAAPEIMLALGIALSDDLE
jgi:4-carboxymuconolactone decarboxylase